MVVNVFRQPKNKTKQDENIYDLDKGKFDFIAMLYYLFL